MGILTCRSPSSLRPRTQRDLGDVANAVGRMYGGDNEDGQALAIIEVWPGPGEPCQRRMISKYGYTHLYVPIRFANTLAPEQGRNTVERGSPNSAVAAISGFAERNISSRERFVSIPRT